MIEKINWDSDFFGYPIGKITISTIDDVSNFFNSKSLKEFRLIYIFSKTIINDYKLKLVDTKLTFKKNIDLHILRKQNKTIENLNNLDDGDFILLEELAYLSGKYSRFNTDLNFKNNEFKKLYHKWISGYKSENKNIILKKSNNIISGFILYSIENETIYIELISVSEDFQEKGIATELIYEIELIGLKNKCRYIQVVTQGENIPAVNLYKKNNFTLINKNLIYHYWNI
jgi:dTDP-4-amino-4,6-dideoxy-D-galactose acyltransferase